MKEQEPMTAPIVGDETDKAITFEGANGVRWRITCMNAAAEIGNPHAFHYLVTEENILSAGFVPAQQLAEALEALAKVERQSFDSDIALRQQLAAERATREQLEVAAQRMLNLTVKNNPSGLGVGSLRTCFDELEGALIRSRQSSSPTPPAAEGCTCPPWTLGHRESCHVRKAKPSPTREEKDSSPSPGAPVAAVDSGAEKPRETADTVFAATDSPGDGAGATKEAQPAEDSYPNFREDVLLSMGVDWTWYRREVLLDEVDEDPVELEPEVARLTTIVEAWGDVMRSAARARDRVYGHFGTISPRFELGFSKDGPAVHAESFAEAAVKLAALKPNSAKKAQPTEGDKCPSCGSPGPKRHPAMQFEGEVQICSDAWHSPVPSPPLDVEPVAVAPGHYGPVGDDVNRCNWVSGFGNRCVNKQDCVGPHATAPSVEPVAVEPKFRVGQRVKWLPSGREFRIEPDQLEVVNSNPHNYQRIVGKKPADHTPSPEPSGETATKCGGIQRLYGQALACVLRYGHGGACQFSPAEVAAKLSTASPGVPGLREENCRLAMGWKAPENKPSENGDRGPQWVNDSIREARSKLHEAGHTNDFHLILDAVSLLADALEAESKGG